MPHSAEHQCALVLWRCARCGTGRLSASVSDLSVLPHTLSLSVCAFSLCVCALSLSLSLCLCSLCSLSLLSLLSLALHDTLAPFALACGLSAMCADGGGPWNDGVCSTALTLRVSTLQPAAMPQAAVGQGSLGTPESHHCSSVLGGPLLHAAPRAIAQQHSRHGSAHDLAV